MQEVGRQGRMSHDIQVQMGQIQGQNADSCCRGGGSGRNGERVLKSTEFLFGVMKMF